ncbi:unnamed protein product, partial [Urochloa humidicola]
RRPPPPHPTPPPPPSPSASLLPPPPTLARQQSGHRRPPPPHPTLLGHFVRSPSPLPPPPRHFAAAAVVAFLSRMCIYAHSTPPNPNPRSNQVSRADVDSGLRLYGAASRPFHCLWHGWRQGSGTMRWRLTRLPSRVWPPQATDSLLLMEGAHLIMSSSREHGQSLSQQLLQRRSSCHPPKHCTLYAPEVISLIELPMECSRV